MGQIRIFNRPPKSFEFDKEDLVIDNVRGDVYYKDDKNRLQKIIKSNDTSTSLSVANLIATTAISSTAITSSAILVGNITASGHISASGTIFADNFQSSGQQQITVADSFNITGSITSSGGISSSGAIIGLTGSFNQTIITLKSGSQESPFIITIADNNGQDNKLEVTKDGALKLGALNTLPTAITGGLVYSSSAFYMGI
tara:strand:+ start:618 stop:1217 length:600 start_codon:yes stop_codon:yes gene_type:complete